VTFRAIPGVLAVAGLAGAMAVMLLAAITSPKRTLTLYREHFRDPRQERLFLSSVGFFGGFVVVRSITISIHLDLGPFRDVTRGGVHIHHLVWGILLLLLIGYLWLVQLATGMPPASRWASRAAAALYGLGAALTLDEFALWLHLEDVYWGSEGRESVRAVAMFGALLSAGLWGRPFFHALVGAALRVVRRA
jgi:hypothetical protein